VTPTTRLSVAVTACAVLAACSSGGSPHRTSNASSRSTPAPSPAAIALTDQRTIDPCSLVPRSALGRFGRVAEGQSDSGLLACDVSVTMADHGVAGVTVRLDATPTSATDRTIHFLVADHEPGGLRLLHPRYENTQNVEDCVHQLDFADGSAICVEAAPVSNLANDDFCKIGRAALDAVLATVISGRLSHRSFPSDTVAARGDICALISPDMLALVPTLRSARLDQSPGGASCTWRNGYTSLQWSLNALPGISTQPIAPYEQRVQIAGRPSLVTNIPTVQCRVLTAGHALGITDLHGKQTREVFAVSIYAPVDDMTGCQIARKVAARVWSRLPR
jgi:hypothetical protein